MALFRMQSMLFIRNKTKFFLAFITVSLIFLYLRAKTMNHLLMWDEAWNILSLRAFLAGAARDPFYWGYFYHPPLYMFFAKFLHPFASGIDLRLEYLSLFFSYATLIVVYLLGARIGGPVYALLCGFFLSVMPASIGYDTWIKRDGLASFLGYAALLALLKKKFFWCGILLSFCLLSKENAVFFIAAATLLILIFKEKNPVKKISSVYAVILVTNFWWYAYFSQMLKGADKRFFVLTEESAAWLNSTFYYVKKLLPDLNVIIIFFVVIGIGYSVYMAFYKKKYEWSLPLIVALSVYLPISIVIVAKSPWLFLPARPALAMIAGGGALYLFEKSKKIKYMGLILAVTLLFAFAGGLSFSYPAYHKKTYANGWPGAYSSRELALYLNKRMRDDDRLLITEFAYWKMPTCAIFLYYWKAHPIEIISGKEKLARIIEDIIKYKISWFVIADSPDPRFNFSSLAEEAEESRLGKPEAVGWSYVWNTKEIAQEGDSAKNR
ncbi:MAG: glycosyltransferase family 39 protein [Candidatus Omnitrophica bacterium]|nr:glycosyltransferase family 39 protein [Candidatus Omnitrophota bacterium]